ncbi:MAG: ATP-binding protein [Gammaproteobacteria bacterium]|nr:ATP-binding protein [Gammaproteobacteria bacterium]
MIQRKVKQWVKEALGRQAAVALIGPRQVGKTTLACEICEERESLYLDLEDRDDREKLSDPRLFLEEYEDRLVVLDEIHRTPEIFQTLRGIIDRGRRKGKRTGRFLVLGSASVDLLRQSGETLAGRIEYVDMHPLDIVEAGTEDNAMNRLWIRGGFPDSYLAESDEHSFNLRKSFIRTYLERDVSQFGLRIPATTLETLWMMLSHGQGALLNTSSLASSLSLSAPTVAKYIDLLVELFLVRKLRPYHANVRKRLVKSPKVYVRDSGLLHALLGIGDFNSLCGHPVVGGSWEGFVIENLLSDLPPRTQPNFYRTAGGAEIDLVLEFPGKSEIWAIEIKRALSAKPKKGFYQACEDIQPNKSFVVYAGEKRYPISEGVEAVSLLEMCRIIAKNTIS